MTNHLPPETSTAMERILWMDANGYDHLQINVREAAQAIREGRERVLKDMMHAVGEVTETPDRKDQK